MQCCTNTLGVIYLLPHTHRRVHEAEYTPSYTLTLHTHPPTHTQQTNKTRAHKPDDDLGAFGRVMQLRRRDRSGLARRKVATRMRCEQVQKHAQTALLGGEQIGQSGRVNQLGADLWERAKSGQRAESREQRADRDRERERVREMEDGQEMRQCMGHGETVL